MNKKFWTGLTTALMTTVGTTAIIGASLQDSEASDTSGKVGQIGEILGIGTLIAQESSNFQTENVVSLGPIETDANAQTSSKEIATLHLHQWQYQLAVTLKIRQIPVLTFLGSKADLAALKEQGDDIDPSHIESEALNNAKAFAHRLNKLSQDNTFKAEKLTVSLNSDQTHSIKLDSEELIKLDKGVILPDTTRNEAVDALQATNRLRRLMGDAPPLTAIVKPEQTPSQESGLASVRPVTSRRKGMASWYGPGFHGRLTANGERYNQNGLTAAHKSLPFGTQVRVTNLRNGRSVIVRINDRGPYIHGRVIDLSKGAANVIGLLNSGVAPVQLEILGR
ncbi:septal ring lytic transglycosylase RlpA family protein [Crocosphaera chwakensis]|uniref:Probable endolytic peptidoglycan transglycosylase RlpA n=1 Tax=Crocosphaera chwakensis CCY0110 TaxID=391612 RepID=A3IMZ3_9CHRO|nr:septal ring lytic transglycosylase RlpA family protein [Crocosphaera chwakensis]EAZ92246.1 rare lipoprotein A [Crocosphaera chwakensis CCY0110]